MTQSNKERKEWRRNLLYEWHEYIHVGEFDDNQNNNNRNRNKSKTRSKKKNRKSLSQNQSSFSSPSPSVCWGPIRQIDEENDQNTFQELQIAFKGNVFEYKVYPFRIQNRRIPLNPKKHKIHNTFTINGIKSVMLGANTWYLLYLTEGGESPILSLRDEQMNPKFVLQGLSNANSGQPLMAVHPFDQNHLDVLAKDVNNHQHQIIQWKMSFGNLVCEPCATFKSQTPFFDLKFSPVSGTQFYTAGEVITLWDTRRASSPAQQIQMPSNASCFDFLSEEEIIVGFDDGSISMFDLRKNAKIKEIEHAHKMKIERISCNDRQDHLLLSHSQDGTLRVWDKKQIGQEPSEIEEIGSLLPGLVMEENGFKSGLNQVQWNALAEKVPVQDINFPSDILSVVCNNEVAVMELSSLLSEEEEDIWANVDLN